MGFLHRWLAIFLIILLASTSSGCSPVQRSAQERGPTLVRNFGSAPKTFNAALSKESPSIFGLTYVGLVGTDPRTGKVVPELAQSWDISADKLKIVFTLRPHLKWSDGAPLTVDDVVFTYNDIYFNPKISTNSADGFRVGEARTFPIVKKLNQEQVEFSTSEPFSPLLRSASSAILPAHKLNFFVKETNSKGQPLFNETWGTDTPPQKLVFNGPYILQTYIESQRLIFKRNPYFWRDQDQSSTGNIETIVQEIIDSPDNELLQFRSGGLDAVGVQAENFRLLKREEQPGNFKIFNGGPALGTSFLFFNLNTGRRNGKPLVDPIKSRWFNSVAFRRAVAYAIDREKMLINAFQGLGELQNSPISIQSPYYLSPKEGLKTYSYNPKQAKELLLQAGFQYNDDQQLLDPEGNRVSFVLLTNADSNKARAAMGIQIKQDLAAIGIKVDFQPVAFPTLVDKLSTTLEWECILLGLTGGPEPHFGKNVWDPEGFLHMFNQKANPGSPPIEGRKVSDWEQQIGKLYIEGAREFDEDKRKEIYAKTQQITQENLPFIYLINPLSMTALRNKFEGIEYTVLGGAFWNIYDISITK